MTYAPGLLCVIESCQCELDAHLSSCHRVGCRGCLPLRAEKNSYACTACRLRARDRLGELAQLWHDLLTPTRVPSSGGRAGGGTERPQTLADPAVQARGQIQVALTAWCQTLGLDLGQQPAVRTMVIHLLAHLPQILASEHAARFAEAVDELWADARRSAYPAAPTGTALGRCPNCATLVRSTVAHGPVRCRGCGQTRTVEEWQQLLVGDLTGTSSATAPDLAAWLSKRHDREVLETTLRQWAARGVLLPGPDGTRARAHLTRVGTGPGSGEPALYSVADAAKIGTGLYGPAKISISA